MENIKSIIIPDQLKRNIDRDMEEQLFNANRYYAESNPDISNLMQQALRLDPVTFLKNLKERWNWHNHYYEDLLEPAYTSIVKNDSKELSPLEVQNIIDIYRTSCLVDEATLVMSGAIKKHLDYNVSKIPVANEYIKEDKARFMLLTPPVETFFAQYQIDHLYYIYLLNTKSTDAFKFREYLPSKYHANDDVIFETRFNEKFANHLNDCPSDLLRAINSFRISKEYKTSHFYFTMENEYRKAFTETLLYDNLDEKLIASNLIGISGFLLRKKILEYLNVTGYLPNRGYIYEFSNDQVIEALEKLKLERSQIMEKDVKPYKQRGDTCAIACLMMAMEYYGAMPKANWYDEKRLYKIYGSRYMDGTPFSALAFHLAKNGLDTTIYHSSKEVFDNSKQEIPEREFGLLMNEYGKFLEHAESNGANIINGIDINCQMLKECLERGNLVILAGQCSILYHAILLCGYEDEKFIVCDPLSKTKLKKTPEELEKFLSTNIGKWFIEVGESKTKKHDLLDNLEQYSDQAHIYMGKKEIKKDKPIVKVLKYNGS